MRTAEVEPGTVLGSLHAARRDLPQFGEAASYGRSGGTTGHLSITLTRPASGVGKTWLIHASKSDIPLDLLSLTLKQRFPSDWRFDCAIADASLSCANSACAYVKVGVAALKSGKGVIRWFGCGEKDSIRKRKPRSEWRYSTSRLGGSSLSRPMWLRPAFRPCKPTRTLALVAQARRTRIGRDRGNSMPWGDVSR